MPKTSRLTPQDCLKTDVEYCGMPVWTSYDMCELADIQNTPRRILTNVPAQHLYVRISQSSEETQEQVAMLREISIKSIFIIASNENAKIFLKEVIY